MTIKRQLSHLTKIIIIIIKKKLINRSVGLKTERKGRGLWLRYTDMHAGEKERKEGSVRRRGSHDSLGSQRLKIYCLCSHTLTYTQY